MTSQTTVHFLFSVAVLLGVAKLLGALARRVRQPAVVGEIVAGVLCGPLVLPDAVREVLLPKDVAPLLSALASVGLALFMFIVGYELDHTLLRGRTRTALGVAGGSVLVPLLAGCGTALLLADRYAPGSTTGFVLFLGIAMSVTAFPVLARVLADRGLNSTPIGGVALAAAALGDLVAWVALAGVAAFCGTAEQWRVSLLPVYALFLLLVVRPALRRLLRPHGSGATPPAALFPLLTAGLLLSCAATEWLGVHYIFGAFAFGAIMPRAGLDGLREHLIRAAGQPSALLLPLYFVVAGSKMRLDGFGGTAVLTLLALLAVAVLGKAVGVYGGARLGGLPRADALPVAVLMNVRGLTEIVILSVGLELHLIDGTVYSMMVIMALVTTAMAGPLLDALPSPAAAPVSPASPASPVAPVAPVVAPHPTKSGR
ncbi:cation:proton antiporter [Kitasatospora sp. NPDC093806]|uniref:cation:proton antiporter n=1 Tax=Kitasatospora sp. NPDC093806 TaxID=3155075 RepID=UPI0034144959